MARRLLLSQVLNEVDSVDEVYFQPNETSRLVYPCITYSRNSTYTVAADNIKYRLKDRYTITLIDRKPENPAFDILINLPYCSHSTSFVADGLNHDVFDLYH